MDCNHLSLSEQEFQTPRSTLLYHFVDYQQPRFPGYSPAFLSHTKLPVHALQKRQFLSRQCKRATLGWEEMHELCHAYVTL